MVTHIDADLTGVRWGPEKWQQFIYYGHPIRDGGGNPVLIWRTGGGGWSGNDGMSEFDYSWPIHEYLLGSTRDVHFDVISVQTAQQQIDDPGGIRRTKRNCLLTAAYDHQRAVSAIKAWGAGIGNTSAFRFDPYKVFLGGHSYGATQSALSMILPPIIPQTSWAGGARGVLTPQQYDSTANGNIFMWGQCDFRNRLLINGTGAPVLRDYLDPIAVTGIWGTRINNDGAEWSLVPTMYKEAVSLLNYIEKGLTDYYTSMFVLYSADPTFDHLCPLQNNHDSRMGEDLKAALRAAKLDYATSQDSPIGPGPTNYAPSLENVQAVYAWLKRRLNQRILKPGAVR